MQNRRLIVLCMLATLFISSCSTWQDKQQFEKISNGLTKVAGINVTYPHDSTIFPPEFPSPHFEWVNTGSRSNSWIVFISDKKGKILITDESVDNKWQPDSAKWDKIKKISPNELYFTVIGKGSNRNTFPSGRIQFSFSNDPVGADIFFRAVTLPFSYAVKNVYTIEWYLGSVNGGSPRKLLDNMSVCANCHSFPSNGSMLAMDVDYGNDKGSYTISNIKDTCLIKPENIISWSDFKRDDNESTFGLLSQISPDGKYVLSTVNDLSVFVAVDDNMAYSQLFFPIKGIIGIYNRGTKEFSSLNGANDSRYVQSNPSWTPDNKKVIFARTDKYISERVKNAGRALLHTKDVEEFSSGKKPFKYDLFSVDFNEGKGDISQPIIGASGNGKSNYFPKVSPDGKWIVFCQADNFMLLQRDSRLYIIPSGGGKPRLMNCNMDEMNSWHSWSPNSRWIVFSSKNRGLYTQLYLTHIDENGMDSPPVLLENLRFDERAANIPEFFPGKGENFIKIKDSFSKTPQYFNKIAMDEMQNNYYKRAWDHLENAIKVDSNYLETYFNRMMLNALLQQSNSLSEIADNKKAFAIILDSLARYPDKERYISMEITALSNLGKNEEAINKVLLAIRKFPNNYSFYELICSLYRKTNQYEKTINYYNKMISLKPSNKAQITNLVANTYMKLGQNEKALTLVNQMIKEYPDVLSLTATKVQILLNSDKIEESKKDLDYIISTNTSDYKSFEFLALYYKLKGDKKQYLNTTKQIINILDKGYNENPDNIDIIFKRASNYFNLNDLQNAEYNYNLILSKFPNNYEALKKKAMIMLNQNKWNNAISIYDNLIANYEEEEEFFNNQALSYIQLGNYDLALEKLNKTIEIDPYNCDARYNRAKLYGNTGNITGANREIVEIKKILKGKKQLNNNERELLKLIN